MRQPSSHHPSVPAEIDLAALVNSLVKDLRFGTVEIIVHEGRVVQVERKEKFRFDKQR